MYAIADDVRLAYENDDLPVSDDRLNYLIQVATVRLNALRPALPAWIDSQLVDPLLARDMVVRAVLRQVRNPAQTLQQTQSTGPFSVTTSQGSAQSVKAWFDDADLALLSPGGLKVSKPGSIRLSSPWLPKRGWCG